MYLLRRDQDNLIFIEGSPAVFFDVIDPVEVFPIVELHGRVRVLRNDVKVPGADHNPLSPVLLDEGDLDKAL